MLQKYKLPTEEKFDFALNQFPCPIPAGTGWGSFKPLESIKENYALPFLTRWEEAFSNMRTVCQTQRLDSLMGWRELDSG